MNKTSAPSSMTMSGSSYTTRESSALRAARVFQKWQKELLSDISIQLTPYLNYAWHIKERDLRGTVNSAEKKEIKGVYARRYDELENVAIERYYSVSQEQIQKLHQCQVDGIEWIAPSNISSFRIVVIYLSWLSLITGHLVDSPPSWYLDDSSGSVPQAQSNPDQIEDPMNPRGGEFTFAGENSAHSPSPKIELDGHEVEVTSTLFFNRIAFHPVVD
ncbi:hypothetical protein GYMLUDRAFT_958338 [Collybiopsis luxurians FD-317 M1]|nr:hypothetical protein GYMLUDRAFT_958338 [Collybiopsis luxurians FD-317 M1]